MAVFENSIIFLLMLCGLLISDSKAEYIESSYPSIQVPGLLVGSQISFKCYGDVLTEIRLDIYDYNVQKIIELKLSGKEGDKDNPPEMLFNTYTNGKFDTNRVINESPGITYTSGFVSDKWVITAEEDGFLIEVKTAEVTVYSYKFPYKSPQKLSDIHYIGVSATQRSSRVRYENGYSCQFELSQTIPKGFTKVLFEGVRPIGFRPFELFIMSGELNGDVTVHNSPKTTLECYFSVRDNNDNYIDGKYNKLTTDYSPDNPIKGIIEKTGDSTYEATVWTSPDISYSYQITDMTAADTTGFIKFGFDEITKLEID